MRVTWAYSAISPWKRTQGRPQGAFWGGEADFWPLGYRAPCPSSLNVSSRFMSPSALPRRRFLPPLPLFFTILAPQGRLRRGYALVLVARASCAARNSSFPRRESPREHLIVSLQYNTIVVLKNLPLSDVCSLRDTCIVRCRCRGCGAAGRRRGGAAAGNFSRVTHGGPLGASGRAGRHRDPEHQNTPRAGRSPPGPRTRCVT